MDYLILALSTWRISRLLVEEEGPFSVFQRLRRAAGVSYDEYSEPVADSQLGKILACMCCCSLWVGIGIGLLYKIAPHRGVGLSVPFALSAGAILIDKIEGEK